MNVLIVDDEPLARARLKRLLVASQTITVLGEASNGGEALALIDKITPDLVFLDIDMPGINGLEVAAELNKLPIPPAIVFITAHGEHALGAIELSAAGYLIKPLSEQSLQAVLGRVGRINKAHVHNRQVTKITYQLAGILKSVELESIYYFNAEQKYTKMVFNTGNALIEQSLKQLEALYPEHFLRIHRNTLVNKSKIIAIHSKGTSNHVIELEGCEEFLPVSRRELKIVKNAL